MPDISLKTVSEHTNLLFNPDQLTECWAWNEFKPWDQLDSIPKRIFEKLILKYWKKINILHDFILHFCIEKLNKFTQYFGFTNCMKKDYTSFNNGEGSMW